MPQFIAYIFGAVLGAVYGSGLTVWLWRSEHTELKGRVRSACPTCKRQLVWYELIPIVSFITLGGACRTCRHPIPFWYCALEMTNALIGALVAGKLVAHPLPTGELVLTVGILGIILAVAAYDAVYRLLPLIPLGAGIFAALVLNYSRSTLIEGVIVGVSTGFFFICQYTLSRGRWIGSGDIPLGILIGTFLIWPLTGVGLWISYVGGAFVSLLLLALRITSRASKLPLGTYLAAGTLTAWLYGEQIVTWYTTR